MSSYKVVASDLDGTLFDNESKISRENLDAINELLAKNVQFVPSSGRTLSEMPAEITGNSAIRYIIYSNGAAVLDRQTGKSILTCIPNSMVRKILDKLNSYETHITIRHNGKSVVDSAYQRDCHYDYYNVCEAHRDAVLKFATFTDDFMEFCYSADNAEVISVFFHNYDDIAVCKNYFEKVCNLRVVQASEYNLEIMNIDAGKGNALSILADMLGISICETVSIGDSDNDCSITKTAGLGLAVSNACESLKEIADEIICSNEEHVVEYVLSHYF